MGAALHTLKGHSSWVYSVTVSADGKLVASGSDDETVRLWDGDTGAALQTLEGHSGSVSSVAVSADGKLVASGSSDKTVRLCDGDTRAALHTLELDTVTRTVSFSTSGQYLVTYWGVFGVSSSQLSTLFMLDYWIVEEGANILWLPPDYRAECVAVQDGMVVLGHSSGRISILKLEQGSKTI